MKWKANAKINLGLKVLNKRIDGFHNIESIFLPIPWYDEILIEPAKHFEFKLNGKPLAGELKNNLCVKAFHLMNSEYEIAPVRITLFKNIPAGAGLGGGSADAATILKMLNEYNKLQLSHKKLEQLAGQLGSDCIFFIKNKPSLVKGRGEQVALIDFPHRYWCRLVNPGIHISTKEAYSLVKPQEYKTNWQEVLSKPIVEWQKHLYNDFEKAILPRYPQLISLREQLIKSGAAYVAMSGSGSTFLALYEDKPMEKLTSSGESLLFQFNA